MKYTMLAITFLVGLLLWMMTPPEGVTVQAWQLFAIFIATIFGMIAKPLPMGAMALVGLAGQVLGQAVELRPQQGQQRPERALVTAVGRGRHQDEKPGGVFGQRPDELRAQVAAAAPVLGKDDAVGFV